VGVDALLDSLANPADFEQLSTVSRSDHVEGADETALSRILQMSFEAMEKELRDYVHQSRYKTFWRAHFETKAGD